MRYERGTLVFKVQATHIALCGKSMKTQSGKKGRIVKSCLVCKNCFVIDILVLIYPSIYLILINRNLMCLYLYYAITCTFCHSEHDWLHVLQV